MFLEKIIFKKLQPHYSSILHFLALVCLYIEIASVFQQIRLPFFLLNDTYLDDFNKVIENISVGYLTGYIVYVITVLYKKHYDRKAHKWGIYDWVIKLNDVKCAIEEAMGVRCEYIDVDLYKELYTENLSKEVEEKLALILSEGKFYEHLLNKKESDALGSILTYRKINYYYTEMSDKQAGAEAEKIKKLCKSIDKIHTSISSFFRNT